MIMAKYRIAMRNTRASWVLGKICNAIESLVFVGCCACCSVPLAVGGIWSSATVGWSGEGVDHRETVSGTDQVEAGQDYAEVTFPGGDPVIHLFSGSSLVQVEDAVIAVTLTAHGQNALYPQHRLEGTATLSDTFTIVGPVGAGMIGFTYSESFYSYSAGSPPQSDIQILVDGSDAYEILFGRPFELEFTYSVERAFGSGFSGLYSTANVAQLMAINVSGMDPDEYQIYSTSGLLYPIPEPATLLLVLVGGTLLQAFSRARHHSRRTSSTKAGI